MTCRIARRNTLATSIAALVASAGLATLSLAQPTTTSATSGSYPLSNAADPASMLNDLAGVFRVDLRINPNQWYGNTAMLNPDGSPAATSPIGVNTSGQQPQVDPRGNPTPVTGNDPRFNDPRQNDPRQNDPRNPGSTDRGGSGVSFSDGDPMNAALSGAVSVRGYSEKRWVLGGNVLQESIVVPDLASVSSMQDMTQVSGDGRDQGATPANSTSTRSGASATSAGDEDPEIGRPSMEALEANRMFQGMSYLAFNPRTNQFTFTSMDSRQAESLSAVGQFLPGANRIEFAVTGNQFSGFNGMNTGAGGQSGVAPGTGTASPTNPNTPTTTTPPGAVNPSSTANPANARQPGANNPNNPSATNPNATNPNNANPSNVNPNAGTPGSNANPLTQQRDANQTGQNQFNQNQVGQNQSAFGVSTPSAGAFDNVRVVIEMISPDQHRVTLYRLNPGQSGGEYNNPYLINPQGQPTDPNANPRNNPADDNDDQVIGASPNPNDPNDPNRAANPNNPGNQNNPNNPGGGINRDNDPATPRTTGVAPRTNSGQPVRAVPDAPGTRPNNANEPFTPQNTTPGQPNPQDPTRPNQPGNQTGNQPGTQPGGQPIDPNNPNAVPGTIVIDPRTGQPVNATGVNGQGQIGVNQFGQTLPDDQLFAQDASGWVVIWQATYTRVDGAEASRYRGYLQRADQLVTNMAERSRARQAGVNDSGR